MLESADSKLEVIWSIGVAGGTVEKDHDITEAEAEAVKYDTSFLINA